MTTPASLERRAYKALLDAHLTLAQAARLLGVSRPTLYKWIRCGAIQTLAIGPPGLELRRIPQTEVERIQRGAHVSILSIR